MKKKFVFLKKKDIVPFVFVVLMIVALISTLILVRQSQETRKGAYFAESSLRIGSPGQSFLTDAGGELLVPVFVETEEVVGTNEKAKVDFAKITLCYGSYLDLERDTGGYVDHLVDFNRDAFDVLLLAKTESDCLTFTVKSEKSADRLKSGMFRVATIRFTAVSVGEGTISIDRERTQVSGSNPDIDSNDMALRLGDLVDVNYTVQFPASVSPTSMPPTGTQPTGIQPTSIPPTSVPPTGTQPTSIPPGGDISLLNFKISFAGVKSVYGCAVAWPVQITIMKDEMRKIYANVPVVNTGDVNSRGEIIFSGSLELVGFYEKEGVAAFIKGPKHLQMKYAKEGQNGVYGKAGGELNLVYSGKVYDFSEYPMLAGDVNQDGWINGIDFSQVKAAAVKYIETEAGGYILEDLDGSCQVNTADTTLLVKSLDEKQGQMY